VSYCFDDKPPPGETVSDKQVADWFITLLKNRALGYHVVTGARPSPTTPIDDKIKRAIADAHCVLGIFTKRLHDLQTGKWFPSQFVLCETACALGFYYNTGKIICGFYEEGIDPHDLALVTVAGGELVQFKRSDLESGKSKFLEYLKKLPAALTAGPGTEGFLPGLRRPYHQQKLRKIYTVYSNGNVTVQNIVRISISDSDAFAKECDGIHHEIWMPKQEFPLLGQMLLTPIDKRRDCAFLQGILRNIRQQKLNVPLTIVPLEQKEGRAYFKVRFLDPQGNPLRLKNHDNILYQYAWGLPKAYATREEELEKAQSEPSSEAYNEAEAVASHGTINEMILELRFERRQGELFSKSPFYQTAPIFASRPQWSHPHDMANVEDDAQEDHEMWFRTYRVKVPDFDGKLRVLWRPASSK
jgi:hypothetical protein